MNDASQKNPEKIVRQWPPFEGVDVIDTVTRLPCGGITIDREIRYTEPVERITFTSVIDPELLKRLIDGR